MGITFTGPKSIVFTFVKKEATLRLQRASHNIAVPPSGVNPTSLNADNLPMDTQVPSYDATTQRFLWLDAGAGGVGLSEADVDARIAAGVYDWAEVSHPNQRLPLSKIPTEITRDTELTDAISLVRQLPDPAGQPDGKIAKITTEAWGIGDDDDGGGTPVPLDVPKANVANVTFSEDSAIVDFTAASSAVDTGIAVPANTVTLSFNYGASTDGANAAIDLPWYPIPIEEWNRLTPVDAGDSPTQDNARMTRTWKDDDITTAGATQARQIWFSRGSNGNVFVTTDNVSWDIHPFRVRFEIHTELEVVTDVTGVGVGGGGGTGDDAFDWATEGNNTPIPAAKLKLGDHPVDLSRVGGGNAVNTGIRFNSLSGLFEATPSTTINWSGLTRGRTFADISPAILYLLENGLTAYTGDDAAHPFVIQVSGRGRSFSQSRGNPTNPLTNIWTAGESIYWWIALPHWTGWAGNYNLDYKEWGTNNPGESRPWVTLDSDVERLFFWVNGVEFDVQVTTNPLPGDRPVPDPDREFPYSARGRITYTAPSAGASSVEEIPIEVRNRISTVNSRYFFISETGDFSSSKVLPMVATGTEYTVPSDAIPAGETRFLAVGRPISELDGADFVGVTYPPLVTPQIDDWINVTHTVAISGTVLRLIRTRTAVGTEFNGRTIEAV